MMQRRAFFQILRSHRKFLIILALTAAVFFAAGTIYGQLRPALQSWIIVQIQTLTARHSPVRVLPRSVDFRLFPLGVTLREVRIIPDPTAAKFLSATTLLEASVNLSYLQILRGQVGLNQVSLRGGDFDVRLPQAQNEQTDPQSRIELFKLLSVIPISRIQTNDLNLRLRVDSRNTLRIDQLNMDISLANEFARLDFAADSVLWTDQLTRRALRIRPEIRLVANPKQIQIEQLQLNRGGSSIAVEGAIQGDINHLKPDLFTLRLNAALELAAIRDWVVRSVVDLQQIPSLSGSVKLSAQLEGTFSKENQISRLSVQSDLQTERFSVMKIFLDQIQAAVQWTDGQLQLSNVSVQSSSHKATTDRILVTRDPDDTSKWLLKSEPVRANLQLHPFLRAMGLNRIPVWLDAEGTLPCEGELAPSFSLKCQGSLSATDLVVKTDFEKGEAPAGALVSVHSISAPQVELLFDRNQFRFNGELKMANSEGVVKGEVGFRTGYSLEFDAPAIDFADLQSLSGLSLEGVSSFKGRSFGTSKSAVLSAELAARNLYLQGFWLDKPKASMRYQAGRLSFNSIQGTLKSSRYSGDLAFDFTSASEPQLAGSFKLPFFDVQHLKTAVERKLHWPIDATGTGQASVTIRGPLDPARMNYSLKASLFRGQIGPETYDQFNFDITSRSGRVQLDRVQLTKGTGTISASGTAQLNGDMKIEVKGSGLRVEETQVLGRSGLFMEGELSLDALLSGPTQSPDAAINMMLARTSIGEIPVPPSSANLTVRKSSVEGTVKLFGNELEATFDWPLNEDSKLSLDLTANDFHFAPLVGALVGPGGKKDFVGIATGKVNLRSAKGGLQAADGQISFDELSIQRGPVLLKNVEPISVLLKEGRYDIQSLRIEGEGTSLVAQTPKEISSRKIDIAVSAKVDLNLLSVFVPFLEELRGYLSASFTIRGSPQESIETLGSAYLDRGFVKIPGLVHPFENTAADLSFNQQKIVINSVRSDWAGGKLTAAGQLSFLGEKNIPVSVDGEFQKVTLNIPEKVKTQGSGEFSLSGKAFPYLLKASYTIRDGLFSKEIGGASQLETVDSRRALFLPRFLAEGSFQPLELDISINLKNGLPVRNALLDGSVRGDLSIQGPPGQPRLSGTIRSDPDSKLIFRDNTFELTSAVLTFEPGPEINPRLAVSARTRLDERDINLLVQGTGKKPEISLTSIPPLPENELLSLLALGVSESQQQQQMNPFAPMRPDQAPALTGSSSPGVANPSAQQGNAATQQVLSNVANQLVKETAQKFGLDVQLSSGFDQTGEATQRIVARKQFTRKFGASFTQSLGGASQTEARFRYRLTDRLSTTLWGQSLERGELTNQTGQQAPNQNRYGLDLEYRFEFK